MVYYLAGEACVKLNRVDMLVYCPQTVERNKAQQRDQDDEAPLGFFPAIQKFEHAPHPSTGYAFL